MGKKYESLSEDQKEIFRHRSREEFAGMSAQEKQTLNLARQGLAKEYAGERVNMIADVDSAFADKKEYIMSKVLKLEKLKNVFISGGGKIDEKILKARSGMDIKKKISSNSLSKRRKSAVKKHSRQIDVLKTMSGYVSLRDDALRDVFEARYRKTLAQAQSRVDVSFLENMKERNPFFAELSDWAAYTLSRDEIDKEKAQNTMDEIIKSANLHGSTMGQKGMMKDMMKHIMAVNLSVFEYKNTEDFVWKLKMNYPALKAFVGAKKLVDAVLGAEDQDMEYPGITKFKAKLSTLEKILETYEVNIGLLSSRYYVLLAKKDLAALSENDIVDRLSSDKVLESTEREEYGVNAAKLKSLPFKAGSRADELYKKAIEIEGRKERDNTMSYIKDILARTGYDSMKSALKDENSFHEKISSMLLIRLRDKHDPQDFRGRFDKDPEWKDADPELVKNNDQHFQEYYILYMSQEELADFGTDFFRDKENPAYSAKEKREIETFKKSLLAATDKMIKKMDKLTEEYREAIHPDYVRRQREAGVRDQELERQKDRERIAKRKAEEEKKKEGKK